MKTSLVSLSKGKKPKNNRSKFFSSLMKRLAGDAGNKVSDLFVEGDVEGFEKEMNAIVSGISSEMKARGDK